MGITDPNRSTYEFPCMGEELNRIENYHDYRKEEKKESNNMTVNSSPLSKSSKKSKKSKLYKCYFDRSIRAAKKGVRQARRTENTNFLLTMSEKDEMDDQLDLDLVEHGLTPFATLFVEQEKMKIWNDFINQSEDEQQQVLTQTGPSSASPTREFRELGRLDSAGSSGSWEDLGDKRSIHPGFSPKECFKRIEQRLQALLSRRHLPLGTLLHLEQDIISFFLEWPHSVYISRLETSFDRMILHALCQYLDLDSNSFDDKDGVRQTQVENQRSEFILPTMTLSDYIEYRNSDEL